MPGEDYSQFGITHGYGLGFEQYSNDTITVLGHMGTGAAQEGFVGWDPATGNLVAVTLNTNNPGPSSVHGDRGADRCQELNPSTLTRPDARHLGGRQRVAMSAPF